MLYKNVPDRRKYRNSGREDGGGACIAALNRQEKRQLREQYEHAIKKDVFCYAGLGEILQKRAAHKEVFEHQQERPGTQKAPCD